MQTAAGRTARIARTHPTAGSLSWARAFGGSAAAGREISDRVSAMGFQEVGIDPDCWLFPSSGDHMVTNRR